MSHDLDQPTQFVVSAEQHALRQMVRGYADRAWDDSHLRAAIEPGAQLDRTEWGRLGAELGLLGLLVPQEWGGSSAGLVETAIVAEMLGGSLAALPYVTTVLAGQVLVEAGDEVAAAEHLAALCAGEAVYAVVATDERGRWMPDVMSIIALDGDGWTLTGTAAHVVTGGEADQLLVLAHSTAGHSLFLVEATAVGVTRTPTTSLDLTRSQAVVRFDNARARLVGTPGEGDTVLRTATDLALVCLAAEELGAAERLLAKTVAYAGSRIQFGRVIGSFQGVKHRCADILVAVEQARSVVSHAAWTVDLGSDDPALTTSLARIIGAEALTEAATTAIQVHGGIGFTWEHAAHLYFKRAYSDIALWGGLAPHRERVAALLLDTLENQLTTDEGASDER